MGLPAVSTSGSLKAFSLRIAFLLSDVHKLGCRAMVESFWEFGVEVECPGLLFLTQLQDAVTGLGTPGVAEHLLSKDAGDGALNCSEGFFGEEGEERQLLVNFDVLPIVRQEKSRWEILQQEQKLMEEKNKRKKALLAKAIAERSKRTQAETVKLSRIQKQLQALDEMVSADIGILRNKIEQASWDYSCARKRYDKAEAEYVAAKLDLQKKTGIKEQLTEHLCTIIQQNELRKARRLEELMRQLEVAAEAENLELEVEAEQMLQQQEAEARRQAAESQRPAAVGMQDTAPQAAGKGQENKDHGGSEAPVELPSVAAFHGSVLNNSFAPLMA
uniref:RAB6-interacting golgin n=1 Tax=Varanus komodoensis TaxID=61221 RepID=A0A8D2LCD2_VARKO